MAGARGGNVAWRVMWLVHAGVMWLLHACMGRQQVAMEMEGGDYTAASALLQQPPNTRPSVDAVSSAAGGACESWDAAFGWGLVRLYVHLGSLAAAQDALAVCEERDPLRSQGLSSPPFSSSAGPPLPRLLSLASILLSRLSILVALP